MLINPPPDAPAHVLETSVLDIETDTLHLYEGGAIFSPCMTFRYLLWRLWDPSKPIWFYGMLNPSKATHRDSDPTLDRQETRTRRNGGGGLIFGNCSAYRETDRLRAVGYSLGPQNRYWLDLGIAAADVLVLGHGPDAQRVGGWQTMRDAIGNRECFALGITRNGWPQHPLYLSYDSPLIPYSYEGVRQ
jgi:hypothetical protein